MRFLKHLLTLGMARFPDMDNSAKRQSQKITENEVDQMEFSYMESE